MRGAPPPNLLTDQQYVFVHHIVTKHAYMAPGPMCINFQCSFSSASGVGRKVGLVLKIGIDWWWQWLKLNDLVTKPHLPWTFFVAPSLLCTSFHLPFKRRSIITAFCVLILAVVLVFSSSSSEWHWWRREASGEVGHSFCYIKNNKCQWTEAMIKEGAS